MAKIDDTKVCIWDGILTIIADVEWDAMGIPTRHEAKEIIVNGEYDNPITLKMIREMYPNSKSIRVIMDTALHGVMYHFQYQGNGSYWVRYGETFGYA